MSKQRGGKKLTNDEKQRAAVIAKAVRRMKKRQQQRRDEDVQFAPPYRDVCCGNCKFGDDEGKSGQQTICRRNPPTVQASEGGTMHATMWPVIYDKRIAWCGKFKEQ